MSRHIEVTQKMNRRWQQEKEKGEVRGEGFQVKQTHTSGGLGSNLPTETPNPGKVT